MCIRNKVKKEEKKRLSKSLIILSIEGAIAVIYVIAVLIIFYKTGAEPNVLTVSFFSALGFSEGVNGYLNGIKTKAEIKIEEMKGACQDNGENEI